MAATEQPRRPRADAERHPTQRPPRTLRAAPGPVWFAAIVVLVAGSLLLGRALSGLPVVGAWWAVPIGLATAVGAATLFVLARHRYLARERAEATLHALMDSSTDVLTVCDASGTLTYLSPAVERSLGRSAQSLVGRRLHELADPEHREAVSRLLNRVVDAGPRTRAGLDVLVVTASGERRWYEWTARNLLTDPLVRGLVVSQRDVTERLQQQARLAHAASHDLLTGLPNRARLLELLDEALLQAAPGAGVALLFIDMDGFKQVNDQHGHATGDELLAVVAQRLRACLRSQDHLGRFGGDEFCAVLTEVRDEAEVRVIIDRVDEAVAHPAVLTEATVTVSASIGMTLTTDRTHTSSALCSAADGDMYRVKRARHRGAA